MKLTPICGKRKTLCKHHLIALGIKNVLHTFHQFTIIFSYFFISFFILRFSDGSGREGKGMDGERMGRSMGGRGTAD